MPGSLTKLLIFILIIAVAILISSSWRNKKSGGGGCELLFFTARESYTDADKHTLESINCNKKQVFFIKEDNIKAFEKEKDEPDIKILHDGSLNNEELNDISNKIKSSTGKSITLNGVSPFVYEVSKNTFKRFFDLPEEIKNTPVIEKTSHDFGDFYFIILSDKVNDVADTYNVELKRISYNDEDIKKLEKAVGEAKNITDPSKMWGTLKYLDKAMQTYSDAYKNQHNMFKTTMANITKINFHTYVRNKLEKIIPIDKCDNTIKIIIDRIEEIQKSFDQKYAEGYNKINSLGNEIETMRHKSGFS